MFALGTGFVVGACAVIIYLAWRLDDYERRLERRWQLDLARRKGWEVVGEYGSASQNPGGTRGDEGVSVVLANSTDKSECQEAGRPARPPHLQVVKENTDG